MLPLPLAVVVAALVPTIWIVDAANGPGTNFTDLPPAIAAATSGDTILVRPGHYRAFSVSGKALTIRGAGAAATFVDLLALPGAPYLQTRIDSVPPGETFYLSGLSVYPGFQSGMIDAGLRVDGSTSRVVLADLVVKGVGAQGTATPGLTVSGGASVHAARCTFTGGFAVVPANGGDGSTVVGGKLAADSCTFTGTQAAWDGQAIPGRTGGTGLRISNGLVTLNRSSCFAGGGGLYGGNGLRAQGSTFARVAGNASNSVAGGSGQVGGTAPFSIDATASVVINGPVAQVYFGPFPPTPLPSGPPLPYLTMTGNLQPSGELAAGSPVVVSLQGMIPSAHFWFLAASAPGLSTAYAPLTLGELLLPEPVAPVFEGTLDALGNFQLALTPAVHVPALVGVPVYTQFGVEDSMAGQIRMSNGLVRIFN